MLYFIPVCSFDLLGVAVFLNKAASRRPRPISVFNVEQIGANGESHAALFYPSMQDVWPEVYITNNVRIVEVRGVRMYVCASEEKSSGRGRKTNRGVKAGGAGGDRRVSFSKRSKRPRTLHTWCEQHPTSTAQQTQKKTQLVSV